MSCAEHIFRLLIIYPAGPISSKIRDFYNPKLNKVAGSSNSSPSSQSGERREWAVAPRQDYGRPILGCGSCAIGVTFALKSLRYRDAGKFEPKSLRTAR